MVLQVPITLYFMTHAYFCFYHALSNVVLRRTAHAVQRSPRICQWLTLATVVFVLAYITALMETVTIAHFPYYRFKVMLLLITASFHWYLLGALQVLRQVKSSMYFGQFAHVCICCNCRSHIPKNRSMRMQHSFCCNTTACVQEHHLYVCVQERSKMYTWGSIFYAIYFWVSFPVFFVMDEKARKIWSMWEAIRDSLASGMAVTVLLDFWRIAFTNTGPKILPWLT